MCAAPHKRTAARAIHARRAMGMSRRLAHADVEASALGTRSGRIVEDILMISFKMIVSSFSTKRVTLRRDECGAESNILIWMYETEY